MQFKIFSVDQNFPSIAFFRLLLSLMHKESNPCLPAGKKESAANSNGSVI
jgi:hypothetical protein